MSFARCVVLLAVCLTPALSARSERQSLKLSTDALVSAGSAYVTSYQQEFAFLLADETTVQQVVSRPPGSTRDETLTRTTRGEVFLTYLEASRHWTVVRDVAEVDGVEVLDREDLAALLSREEFGSVARRLFALNARYNIGRVVRNFNDPMLALLPLNQAHRSRFRFSVEEVDRSQPGLVLATLRFRERDRPTLVRGLNGGPVYASGEIEMDAATGVVRRTRFATTYDNVDAELTTDFMLEPRLGLWVPAVFAERYSAAKSGRKELTMCESRYTNYRRFEARGRILER